MLKENFFEESRFEENELEDLNKLIQDLRDNRKGLSELLEDVKNIREKAEQILPNVNDFRNRYLFDNKIKLLATIFELELKIREKIDNSIKTELDERRKNLKQNEKDSDSEQIDREKILLIAKLLQEGNNGGDQR